MFNIQNKLAQSGKARIGEKPSRSSIFAAENNGMLLPPPFRDLLHKAFAEVHGRDPVDGDGVSPTILADAIRRFYEWCTDPARKIEEFSTLDPIAPVKDMFSMGPEKWAVRWGLVSYLHMISLGTITFKLSRENAATYQPIQLEMADKMIKAIYNEVDTAKAELAELKAKIAAAQQAWEQAQQNSNPNQKEQGTDNA